MTDEQDTPSDPAARLAADLDRIERECLPAFSSSAEYAAAASVLFLLREQTLPALAARGPNDTPAPEEFDRHTRALRAHPDYRTVPRAPSAGQVEAAVERALTQHQVEWIDGQVGWACGCDEDGRLDLPDEATARRHVTRAALAAARGLRHA